jgi:hypothetical protein
MKNKKTIEEVAHKWVFETNGDKWSNNDDTAGDNYGSFIEGVKSDTAKDYWYDKFQQEQTLKEKLVIELNEYDYTGSSNDIYGMVVKVNGVEMPYHNLDTSTILEEVLEHLGYEVEIIETLDR